MLLPHERTIAGQIMVALDYPDVASVTPLLKQLEGIPCYLKVGMQLFYAAGPNFIATLKSQGYRVFLDLKLHDIPNTVRGAASSITRLGVDMFNVHAAGGKEMMRAAMQGIDEGFQGQENESRPVLIAVTQLTSTSQLILNEEVGIPGAMNEAVIRYARLTSEVGLSGVVASPWEVAEIKKICGPSFITVTPGIRPAGTEPGDQARTMTPVAAFGAGTDYIVVGRPVTKADEPRQALLNIIRSCATP